METKICTKCKQSKPLLEFGRQSASKDGYKYYCKICISQTMQQRYNDIRPKQIAQVREWQKNNIEKRKAYQRRFDKTPIGKLRKNLRRRLKDYIKTIKNNSQSFSLSKSIGCKYKELQKLLESKFLPGMTWENYGTQWHVDHVRPLSSFNLMDPTQRAQANHFSNLQPLWAKDNIAKGDSY